MEEDHTLHQPWGLTTAETLGWSLAWLQSVALPGRRASGSS